LNTKSKSKRCFRISRRAIEQMPNQPNPRFQELMWLWQLGRKREAIRLTRKYEKDFSDDPMGIAAVRLMESLKRLRPLRAVKYYREVQKHTNALDELETEVGKIEHHSGNFGPAQRSLIEAYQRNPYDAEICADLAENYFMCLKLSKAREMARYTRDLDPSRHGKMTRLIWMSYLTYFPPCWNFAAFSTAMTELSARTHLIFAVGICYYFNKMLMAPTVVFFMPIKAAGFQSIVWASLSVAFVYVVLYASTQIEGVARWSTVIWASDRILHDLTILLFFCGTIENKSRTQRSPLQMEREAAQLLQ